MATSVTLVRHGETEWSRAGRHTGSTDLALTEAGCVEAERLGLALQGQRFDLVLTSPMARAVETATIAGFGKQAQVESDLLEWNYGEYEGITTAQIHETRPDWNLFRDGAPGGEDAVAIGARVDRVLEKVRSVEGTVALFAHGHVLRVLGARWVRLPPEDAALLALSTATISTLGYERETPVVSTWNMSLEGRFETLS